MKHPNSNSGTKVHKVRIYLNSYKPLVSRKSGLDASIAYDIPPFVDASCRREPDFESFHPSISALCRGQLFAPRVNEGDIVVYITTKGNHLRSGERHWRLVAILQVLKRFATHEEAAAWYEAQNLPLPTNCLVPGNPPLPLNVTIRNPVSVVVRGCNDGVGAAGACGSGASCGTDESTGHDKPLQAWDRSIKKEQATVGFFWPVTACILSFTVRRSLQTR